MASTITLNLSNGQSIFLPFQVNINISGQGGAKITAVCSQIDDGDLHDVGNCLPPLPDSPVAGSCTIEGLAPNSWHTLTIYAWDEMSADPTILTVTFHVFDPGSGPPLGGP